MISASVGVISTSYSSYMIRSCDIRNIVGDMIYSYHNRTNYPFEDCHKNDSLIIGLVLGGVGLLLIISALLIYFVIGTPYYKAKPNREPNNTLIV